MIMKDSHKRYKECLDAIHDDCQKNGFTTGMNLYAQTYGVNSNVGCVLVKIEILRKEGRKYFWNRRKPDSSMVIQLMDALSAYGKSELVNETKEKFVQVSEPASKLNLDDLLNAFDMLPKSISLEDRKSIAKKMVAWKNE